MYHSGLSLGALNYVLDVMPETGQLHVDTQAVLIEHKTSLGALYTCNLHSRNVFVCIWRECIFSDAFLSPWLIVL